MGSGWISEELTLASEASFFNFLFFRSLAFDFLRGVSFTDSSMVTWGTSSTDSTMVTWGVSFTDLGISFEGPRLGEVLLVATGLSGICTGRALVPAAAISLIPGLKNPSSGAYEDLSSGAYEDFSSGSEVGKSFVEAAGGRTGMESG